MGLSSYYRGFENGKREGEEGYDQLKKENTALKTKLAEAEVENKKLTSEFTGKLDQPPLELIRAKCEQYWNENVSLCPEEMHATLAFIHHAARSADYKRVKLEERLAEARKQVRRLCSEIKALGFAERDVREVIGNTNWNALMGKVEEGEKFLDPAETEEKTGD